MIFLEYKLLAHQFGDNLYQAFLLPKYPNSYITPPMAEIMCVKNVGAIVVCGFLMKWLKIYAENMKKIMGAIWELPAK